MKTLLQKFVVVAMVLITATAGTMAQRVIKGTVYRDGKPAAGVVVEAHKSTDQFYTSFDGKYEIKADPKSKYIKFTFPDEERRLDIEGNESNLIDYSFDGTIPAAEEEENNEGVILKTAAELMQAQDNDFMNALSLYNEFYKQSDYKSALPHWSLLYEKYPKSTLNIYIHGINMYESFLEKATSQDEKDKHLQMMMHIYDKRIRHFNQKGFVLGRKGTDWLKYKLMNENLSDNELKDVLKKGFTWLEESIKEQGKETEAPVFIPFMQCVKSLFRMGELPKESVVTSYDMCNDDLKQIIAEKPTEEDLKKIQNYIEQIFGTSGAADCETLLGIFTQQFAERSNDIDFVKSMLRRLNQANCDESDLYARASEKLYELEPSPEAAFNMARMFVKKNDDQKAKSYYRQAMEQETDRSMLENYYYEYALFIFVKENAYSEARGYARRALDINPQNCKALMLIGDIYAASSRSFSSDDFERSTVFWVVVDYYSRARAAGGDCLTDASQKAVTYRRYFPNKEEAFFRGITKEGQPYKVEGWINETTTARF